MHDSFIGRQQELTDLNQLLQKTSASIVTIRGRRRIGKSRLIDEFIKNKKRYKFCGLAPDDGVTDQDQRNEFAKQLSIQTGLPEIKTTDWGDLFRLLAETSKNNRVIIVLDEITWMAGNDKTFLSKLKNVWEQHLKNNNKLILIICGSVSTWINKNILSATGYFGRISLNLLLNELTVPESSLLLHKIGFNRSVYEKLILLSILGGVPWYLEQTKTNRSAIQNISDLFFSQTGILANDFHYIFHALYGRREKICEKIVFSLAKGSATYEAIKKDINYPSSGALSEYIQDLIDSGFVSKDYAWDFKTTRETNICKYRLKDNYLRFYLKYVSDKLNKIKKGLLKNVDILNMPGMTTTLGLQFENLVLNNRFFIHQKLGLKPEEIKEDNPYLQTHTKKKQGCQIDYLVQTRHKTLFVCEIKFSQNPIGKKVLNEIQEKIKKLSTPRGYTCIPVLIYSGEISGELEKNPDIILIDFKQFFELP